jgi:hypothetical protein
MRQQGAGLVQAARAGDPVLTGGATDLAGSAPGAAGLRALAEGAVPAARAGFDDLSHPQIRVAIEAIVTLARPA